MVSALAIILVPSLLTAEPNPEFAKFLADVRNEAKAKGLKPSTLVVLDDVPLLQDVIDRDRKQPEKTMTFARFLELILTEQRIATGRQVLEENKALLEATSKKYGVPKEIIVALWGIESKYGAITGDFPVVHSLATLAWEGRRREFFRKELLHALAILDQGHIDAARFKGSWAGAMGQCQFMPTTFASYAADGDGDGKRDIWTNKADVFASAAHYLSKLRWDTKTRWGREVTLPEKLDPSLIGMKQKPRSISEWRKLGLTTLDGTELPDEAKHAWLLRPDGETGSALLAYPNFKVILNWNRSHYFAALIGMLADRIAAPAPNAAR